MSVPLAVESCGRLGRDASRFLSELGVLQRSGKIEDRLKKNTRKETKKEGKHLGRKPQEEGKLELT